MIVAGFVCVQAAPTFDSLRGDRGPTILAADRPMLAAGALLVCLCLGALIAIIVGKMVNTAVGLFVFGAGVFTLDGRLHGLRELVFATPDRSTMFSVAIETGVLAILTLGLVLVVFKLAGGFRDVEPQVDGTRPHWLTSDAAFKSAGAGILVLPAVWLIAQSPMKGQAIAAVFFGAMVSGLVGRLLAPHVQPILVYVSPMIFGAIGHVIAGATMRTPLDDAYIAGAVSAFARVMPLDYLAGSLLGVSFGLGWAKSFLHHEDVAQPAKA
jgi:hypothetical protein